MAENNTTAGGNPAAAGVSSSGQGTQPQYTMLPRTNGNHVPDGGDLLAEIDALVAASTVHPADVITLAAVQEIAERLAAYQGQARAAALDALRPLIGCLPREERGRLRLYALFEPPKQHEQIEHYLATCPAAPGEQASVFVPKSLADLLAMPPKCWLVDQVIGAGDVAMLYGPPGSGKSFIVIDLIFAACLGQQWARRFTVDRPLAVAYCAGEGVSGLPQRFAAAAQHYGAQTLPGFTFFDIAPQLFAPERDAGSATADGIGRFVSEWQERQLAGQVGALDLLIVDTLHSATAGADENSAQDMGQVLKAVKAAARALGCAVLLVHHSNKAGTGERGSSAMRGAMDCMLEVKPTAGKFALECAKIKDGASWKPQTFDLIELGESARVWWDEPGETAGDGRKSETAREILRLLENAGSRRLTMKQISEATGSKPQTINKVIVRIEKEKLIKREQNERGTWCFTLTPEGKEALQNNGMPI
jgi:predicted transcriptional regulator